MQVQQTQQPSTISAALNAAYHEIPARRVILTVRHFTQRNPAFTAAALRNLIFKADERESTKGKIPGNGLIQAGAIVRLGRKVLVDEARFFDWLEAQQGAR